MTDLVLYNGRFFTQAPDLPWAAAVAIRGARILAAGSDDEIRALAGPDARSIDLGGRLVLPGLTDAHFHFRDWALGLRRLALAGAESLADLRERLAQRAEETPPGEWILGQGWNESRWPEPRMPTRADLDDVAPHHPVILWRSDLHLAVANSQALQRASITGDTPDPPKGIIDRDESGEPTGVLRDLAINMVSDIIPPPTEEETVEAMREGLTVLHRLGLTGVHDQRIMGGADGPLAFHAYQNLQASGDLALRLWMSIPSERLDEAVALGLRSGFGDDYLRVGHVKAFSDGGQGARTAWMLEPYEDTGDCGMPLTPMEEIAAIVRKADRAGLAVAVHAIGDRANRELIALFERVTQHTIPVTPIPHRIEHVQMIRPDDVIRLARLGIVASVQPIHTTDDIPMVENSVGARGRFAYPFRDMLDAGVTLAFGSDAPVADPNPLFGIHAAVTRQRRDGTPSGGWYPQQRLTVAEAVWGYTMGAALASGREAELGSITPGKLADLIVLDRDIFAVEPMEIAGAQVVMTIFDGRVVYEQ
ncbi:MAG TPA: amidohydrolase [Chloroflexi bacterium]|nr:amidohydrolase [Chloroflexota bacterium]